MDFRILHISDVHFAEEATSNWVKREQILERIKEKAISADCLVISGDLFHRGSLKEDEAKRCLLYVQEIKELLRASYVLVVPGNHDLDRFARYKEEAHYNSFKTRRDLVYRAGQEATKTKGEYKIGSDKAKKYVLYSGAFAAFQRFSKEIGSSSYNNPEAALTPENYEVQAVTLPFTDNIMYGVRFVLLNTALFAGQSVRGKEYREYMHTLESEQKAAIRMDEPVEAAHIALKIAKKHRDFENDGEIIVDEEGNHRLGLSKEGNEHLSRNVLKTTDSSCQVVSTLFVGHHGFNYLSTETIEALKNAMKRCNSSLYICGHAHLARHSRFELQSGSQPRDVNQIQAGVMFHDSEDYAQYGFNYITIDISEGNVQIAGYSHYLEKAPSLESVWREEKTFRYNTYVSMNGIQNSKTNTRDSIENKLDLEEKNENIPSEQRIPPTMNEFYQRLNRSRKGGKDTV